MDQLIDTPSPFPLYQETHRPQSSRWRIWFKRIAIAGTLLVAVVAGCLYWIWNLSQAEPDFYSQILEADPDVQEVNGDKFERKILDFRNELQLSDLWHLTLTQDQINGWLAMYAKKRFPDLFPPEISDPRVVIEEDHLTIASRLKSENFSGVLTLKAQLFVTDVINQIGIRVKSLHSGMLPIPVSTTSAEISKAAQGAGIELTWDTQDSDPVALVTLLEEFLVVDNGDYVEITSVEFTKGQVEVTGKIHPLK